MLDAVQSRNKLLVKPILPHAIRALCKWKHTFPLASGLASACLYLALAWSFLIPQAMWSPDEGAKLLQTRSLRIEDGRFMADIPYLGRELDPELNYVYRNSANQLLSIAKDGALQLRRLPSFTLLSAPLLNTFSLRGLYVLPAVCGGLITTLTLLLAGPMAGSESRRRRVGIWLLVAFGSPIAIYSTLFWEHTVAVLLGLLALWLLVGFTSSKSSIRALLAILSGLGFAASIYLRLELMIFAFAALVGVWLTIRERRLMTVVAGFLIALALTPYMPLQNALFGTPVPDNATWLLYPFFYLSRAESRWVQDLLIGPYADEAIRPGFIGGLWALTALIALVQPQHNSRVQTLCLLIASIAGAALLFTPEPYRAAHGLLFTTPWALLGLCKLRSTLSSGEPRIRLIAVITALGLLGYIIGYVVLRAATPHGGLEWGARFAMAFYPGLAILTLCPSVRPPIDSDMTAQRVRKRAMRWSSASTLAAAALVFLGFGFQARGFLTIRQDKQISLTLNHALDEWAFTEVVTDLWWLPLDTSVIVKPVYVISSASLLASWVKHAADNGIYEWTMVTLDERLLDETKQALDKPSVAVVGTKRIGNLLLYNMRSLSGMQQPTP